MAILISIYWLLAFNLMWTEWWIRTPKHLAVYYVGLAALLAGAFVARDPAALFLEILPVGLTSSLVMYLIVEIVFGQSAYHRDEPRLASFA